MNTKSDLFIDGEFCASQDGSTFTSINPVTEERIAAVALAGSDDVDRAVAAAESASEKWAQVDPRVRGKAMMAMAEVIERDGESLAQLDSLDAGKPITDCREDIHAAAGLFRYFAGMTDKISGTTLPVGSDKLCYTTREPYGVIAAITAWNYPLFNAAAKIAPILATGNACVLKPAEEAPLTALALAEMLSAVEDVPPGLINVVNGPGETTGSLLTHHPRIRKVTFTGSTDTGRQLLRASADSNIKGLTLELGGKSPILVFADANIEAALNAITFSVFYNAGQTCTAATRLLVEESALEQVVLGLKERAERIIVGDPSSENTLVGPVVSRTQYEKVMGFLELVVESGAELICGGRRPVGLERGYFIEPTILLKPRTDSRLSREEIFGPVLVVDSFASDEEAIQKANDSEFGLAGSVWTSDVTRLHNVARRLQAGIVWCNTVFAEHPGAPAGGFKQSGFGREFGQAAIDEYTWTKTVWVDLTGEHFEWA